MSLLEYGRILIQRGWIIAICTAIAAGGMYLYSARQTAIFQSTQVLLIQPVSADLGISYANRSLLNSYVVYLNSSFIAQEIAEELEMGISGAELKGRTEIGANPDNLTIEVRVNDTDGEQANRVAFAWGQKLVQLRQAQNENLPNEEHINVIPQDFPTFTQFRPRTFVNMALGGMAGLVFGSLIVFVLEFRQHRIIYFEEDAERLLGSAPLAVVPGEE